jgi:hypothetical protein
MLLQHMLLKQHEQAHISPTALWKHAACTGFAAANN